MTPCKHALRDQNSPRWYSQACTSRAQVTTWGPRTGWINSHTFSLSYLYSYCVFYQIPLFCPLLTFNMSYSHAHIVHVRQFETSSIKIWYDMDLNVCTLCPRAYFGAISQISMHLWNSLSMAAPSVIVALYSTSGPILMHVPMQIQLGSITHLSYACLRIKKPVVASWCSFRVSFRSVSEVV